MALGNFVKQAPVQSRLDQFREPCNKAVLGVSGLVQAITGGADSSPCLLACLLACYCIECDALDAGRIGEGGTTPRRTLPQYARLCYPAALRMLRPSRMPSGDRAAMLQAKAQS